MSTEPNFDQTTLARLVVDALERTAFVLADPCDEPESLPPADTFAQIDFSGPTTGCVELLASRDFAKNLAASILGTDAAAITDIQSEEALRELANIVGGSVITAATTRCASSTRKASASRSTATTRAPRDTRRKP